MRAGRSPPSCAIGIYLWSQTVLTELHDGPFGGTGTVEWMTLCGFGLAVSTAIAAASWYAIERPVQHAARRWPRMRVTRAARA